jgi:hypothetical protein
LPGTLSSLFMELPDAGADPKKDYKENVAEVDLRR